jgi:cation diffusion facilitator CzcD-associated flavoprotein CzcO
MSATSDGTRNGGAPHLSNGHSTGPQHVRVAIVGGGLGGLGAAIHLRRAGYSDVVVLERGDELGGTWRDNTYPGCACDVPSALYSYSFAPKPDWSRFYAPQPEIRSYVREVAREVGIEQNVRFGAEVLDARWDSDSQRWHVSTTAGEFVAQLLVSATGPWSEPVLPDIPGLADFEGHVFHSSRWDHEHRFDGARVAVVGTGASAVQFVPELRKRAAQVTVFQRTAQWVLPKADRRVSRLEQALFRRIPATQRALRGTVYGLSELVGFGTRNPRAMRQLQRIAEWHLRRSVQDPELRAALTADHTLGCKRLLFSNHWYPALASPNVDLVPHAVEEIRPHGVVGADGIERAADTLILGTGFTITKLPIADRIRGADGQTLAETWAGSPRGYLGTTVAGFPNMFVLLGPNIGNGHSSAILLHETQAGYLVDALRTLDRHGLESADVRPEVQDAFNEEVQRRLAGSIWNAGGCASYYIDETGRNSTIFPWSTIELRRRLRHFDRDDYLTTVRRHQAAAV